MNTGSDIIFPRLNVDKNAKIDVMILSKRDNSYDSNAESLQN